MTSVEWVALCLVPHLGGQTLRQLLIHFDHDLPAILAAPLNDLKKVRGIGAKLAHAISTIDLESTRRSLARWDDNHYLWLDWNDPRYPATLNILDDAPPLLFFDSLVPDLRLNDLVNQPMIAIVGTRQADEDIRRYTQDIAAMLAQQGALIISGLALGVDTSAHMGALAIPHAHTFAVLGGGVGNIYPPQNRSLAQAVRSRGALISENAPDAPSTAPRLVARNRLITGLAQTTLIVQTRADGGAMHAARFASKQGKTLITLDLPDDGNQALIQQGVPALTPQSLGNPLHVCSLFGL